MSGSKRKSPSFAFIFTTTGFLMLFALGMIPYFVKPCVVSSRNACVAVLKMIDGAKEAWAQDERKQNSDIPTMTDLCGPTKYLRDEPQCPAKGVYALGRIDQKPRCSFPGHEAFLACAEVVDESGKPLADVRLEGLAGSTHLFSGKTDARGRTELITVYDTDAENWAHGTNRFVVTKSGYRTERLSLPDFWPLRVMLKQE